MRMSMSGVNSTLVGHACKCVADGNPSPHTGLGHRRRIDGFDKHDNPAIFAAPKLDSIRGELGYSTGQALTFHIQHDAFLLVLTDFQKFSHSVVLSVFLSH